MNKTIYPSEMFKQHFVMLKIKNHFIVLEYFVVFQHTLHFVEKSLKSAIPAIPQQ